MLDERSSALLAAVNECCGDGFKIIDEGELGRLCPSAEGEIGQILDQLEARGLIEMRYKEGGLFCVRALPAGRSYAKQEARERGESVRRKRETALYSALGGFSGAFVAALLVGLAALFLL